MALEITTLTRFSDVDKIFTNLGIRIEARENLT
jgi:hypothetical protein